MLPGITVTLTVAVVSYLGSLVHASFDPLVIAIIFGMMVANLLGQRTESDAGAQAMVRFSLPMGIALYGLQLHVTGIDTRYGVLLAAAVVVSFGVTYFLSRAFGVGRRMSFLLASGMSICGASAIAVIAPLVGARREDLSASILAVMVVGLSAMVLYRILPDFIATGVEGFAFLCGATLPMFGQVKVAASSMGAESLAIASNVKVLRISALTVLAVGALFAAHRFRAEPAEGLPALAVRPKVSVPWFMVVFLTLAALANVPERAVGLHEALDGLRLLTAPLGKFLMTVALAGIGMSIDFDAVSARGATPLVALGISCVITATAVYLALGVSP